MKGQPFTCYDKNKKVDKSTLLQNLKVEDAEKLKKISQVNENK